eukprot:Em0008g1269a
MVRSFATKKAVSLDTLCADKATVFMILRDFASHSCRLGALKLNGIKSTLETHDVNVVVIGREEAGSHDFVTREFFSGDIYVLDKTSTTKFNPLEFLSSLFLPKEWQLQQEVLDDQSDMKLADYEFGGVVVVCQGGDRVLLNHRQTSLADHISNHTILKTLGIPRSQSPNTNI